MNYRQQQKFILDYLRSECCVDATNEPFHEAFFQRFGGKRRETYWGSQPVRQAQLLLGRMYRDGLLDRRRTSLGVNWQPGFPRWVYSYSLAATLQPQPTERPIE